MAGRIRVSASHRSGGTRSVAEKLRNVQQAGYVAKLSIPSREQTAECGQRQEVRSIEIDNDVPTVPKQSKATAGLSQWVSYSCVLVRENRDLDRAPNGRG